MGGKSENQPDELCGASNQHMQLHHHLDHKLALQRKALDQEFESQHNDLKEFVTQYVVNLAKVQSSLQQDLKLQAAANERLEAQCNEMSEILKKRVHFQQD